MTHVEIWLGEGEKTIGARWNNGKVQVFDSYKFSPKSFTNEQYYFRSIDTWLRGICKRCTYSRFCFVLFIYYLRTLPEYHCLLALYLLVIVSVSLSINLPVCICFIPTCEIYMMCDNQEYKTQ